MNNSTFYKSRPSYFFQEIQSGRVILKQPHTIIVTLIFYHSFSFFLQRLTVHACWMHENGVFVLLSGSKKKKCQACINIYNN